VSTDENKVTTRQSLITISIIIAGIACFAFFSHPGILSGRDPEKYVEEELAAKMPNALYKIIEVKSFDHGMVVVVRTGTDKEPYFFSYYLINGDDEEKFGLKKGSLSSHGFSRTFNLVSGSIEPTNVSIKHFAEKNGLLKVSPSDQTKPDGNTEPNVKPPVASATPPPPVEEVEIGKLITIDKKSDSDKIKEFSQWGNKFFGSFSGTILIASNEKANFKHDNVQFD